MIKTKLIHENEIPLKFNKEHTLITKGVLILLMVMHHVLMLRGQYNVQTLIKDQTILTNIVSFGSICVAGFAFLSAYGMTQDLKTRKDIQWNSCFKWICIRLIKLESSIFFIYVLAILYKRLIIKESINALYSDGTTSLSGKILFMIINALGMSDYFGTPNINMTWWYLHIAILLIITMPFLYMMYEKFRYLLIPVLCLLPLALSPLQTVAGVQSHYAMLLSSVILGIAFSYEEWFEKIKAQKFKILKFLLSLIILKLTYDIWVNINNKAAYNFVFIIPFIVFEFFAEIPILRSALKLIGKHATNIFLIHTFIYFYWYADYIFSFQKSWCIISVLLIICLILSMIIELLKKYSGYNRLITEIIRRIE